MNFQTTHDEDTESLLVNQTACQFHGVCNVPNGGEAALGNGADPNAAPPPVPAASDTGTAAADIANAIVSGFTISGGSGSTEAHLMQQSAAPTASTCAAGTALHPALRVRRRTASSTHPEIAFYAPDTGPTSSSARPKPSCLRCEHDRPGFTVRDGSKRLFPLAAAGAAAAAAAAPAPRRSCGSRR